MAVVHPSTFITHICAEFFILIPSAFSFFQQTRGIFRQDPSVYCVSLGNMLYPALLPKIVLKPDPKVFKSNLTNSSKGFNEYRPKRISDGESETEKARREVEISKSDFLQLPSKSTMRRVDHFLFQGGTMITRNLMQEIIDDFTLPPFPTTRSNPRSTMFKSSESVGRDPRGKNLNKTAPKTNDQYIKSNENFNKENHEVINLNFDVMVS